MQTNYVFLLNADKTPLDLIHPARARELQSKGKVKVFRHYPYVLILQHQIINPVTKFYSIKIDPGSIWTGFALQCGDEILFKMELKHRSLMIRSDLEQRAGFRRGRRSRNLRYRKKRFNCKKRKGWLAPSLIHQVLTVETWIKRFIRYCPVTCIEIEQVRFDMQKLMNPEISGTQYQQGTLMGYEVRQYLLEKWGRKCAYCNAENLPLEIEHICPKSKGVVIEFLI
ncbi:MAG: RNA-guided endonuclease IscB [Brasilonema sp.]